MAHKKKMSKKSVKRAAAGSPNRKAKKKKAAPKAALKNTIPPFENEPAAAPAANAEGHRRPGRPPKMEKCPYCNTVVAIKHHVCPVKTGGDEDTAVVESVGPYILRLRRAGDNEYAVLTEDPWTNERTFSRTEELLSAPFVSAEQNPLVVFHSYADAQNFRATHERITDIEIALESDLVRTHFEVSREPPFKVTAAQKWVTDEPVNSLSAALELVGKELSAKVIDAHISMQHAEGALKLAKMNLKLQTENTKHALKKYEQFKKTHFPEQQPEKPARGKSAR